MGFRVYTGVIQGVDDMYIYIYMYITGLYRDNGKEDGNYCLGFRVIL